jgi:hypothetical protein
MKHVLMFFGLALVMFTLSVNAQEQPTRYKKQHLKKIEQQIVSALKNDNPEILNSAAATIRQLEMTYPEESFDPFVKPLIHILKDEKADARTRLLVALALDGLHSDEGDDALMEIAKSSSNKSLQDLCSALTYKTESKR